MNNNLYIIINDKQYQDEQIIYNEQQMMYRMCI